MKFEYTMDDKDLIVSNLHDFDLGQTLECGQCFHFEKLDEDEYVTVYKKYMLHAKQDGNELRCFNTSVKEFEDIWINYFDLNRDYNTIKKFIIEKDSRLESAIEENNGIRIMNQDFPETLMSFIISQNKQIPHIKKIVKDLSEKYGNCVGEVCGNKYYAFPDINQLGTITEENYKECRTGFRAPYLLDASRHLTDKEYINLITETSSYEDTKELLKRIKGVGDKVANCVMLFSMGYREAFPVDVWIKRIMESMYFEKETDNKLIMEFAEKMFGSYGGYAQQYLFCYARKNN